MADPIARWNAAGVIRATEDVLTQRVTQAAIVVRDTTKRLINRGNPTGKEPSAPGEPPKKVSGRLFQSVVHAPATKEGTAIVARVGTNVEYARRLELGFVGRDALGRIYNQAPRPYLRPGLRTSGEAIRRLLGVRR